MSATERAEALQALLGHLAKSIDALPPDHAGPPAPGTDALLHQLVFSMLLWETTLVNARAALRKVQEIAVDFNELRVCLPDEIAEAMGARMPGAEERAERLRAALREVYRREQSLSLTHLTELPKRDARSYLESIEGVPPYVAARVTVLELGGHAFPVDERLRAMLEQVNVADPGASVVEVAGSVERMVRANEVTDTYLLLEAWRQSGRAGKTPARTRSKSASRRKAAK